MKRLLLGLCCALLLCCAGTRTALAQDAQGANSGHKTRWSWFHREKHDRKNSTESLYSTPKSVGWWHHRGPGPAGAGADLKAKSPKVRREKKRRDKSTQLYASPKSTGLWHHSAGPAGAGAK